MNPIKTQFTLPICFALGSSPLLKNPFKVYSAKIILLVIFVLLPFLSFSQVQNRYDSLDLARNLMNELKFSESLIILDALEKTYPQDFNVVRLKGQLLYWKGDFEQTVDYFKNAIEQNPDAHILKLDLGRILFELNRLEEAKNHLYAFADFDPKDPEAQIMLAKIAYWQGKPPKKAILHLENVLEQFPTNPEALALKQNILLNTSPQLNLSTSYYTDSQPLQALQGNTTVSFYQSALLQPSVSFQGIQFGNEKQNFSFQLANKTAFVQTNTEILVRAGLFKNSWTNELQSTWEFDLRQKTFAQLIVSAGASRMQYLYTLASLNQNVLPILYKASIGRETGESWTGKAAIQQWNFQDNNTINMGSVWFLFPIIKKSPIRIDVGYAFMMADSEENRFTLVEPVTGTVNQTEIGQVFPGVFDPYFTPQNQRVHSALAKLDVEVSSKVRLSFNGNFGVYATIDNPNFIFYGASNTTPEPTNPGTGTPGPPSGVPGNPNAPGKPQAPIPSEDIVQAKDIYRILIPTKYFPVDLKSKINLKINPKINLHTEYAYLKTIFFDSHTVSLGLNWIFINE